MFIRVRRWGFNVVRSGLNHLHRCLVRILLRPSLLKLEIQVVIFLVIQVCRAFPSTIYTSTSSATPSTAYTPQSAFTSPTPKAQVLNHISRHRPPRRPDLRLSRYSHRHRWSHPVLLLSCIIFVIFREALTNFLDGPSFSELGWLSLWLLSLYWLRYRICEIGWRLLMDWVLESCKCFGVWQACDKFCQVQSCCVLELETQINQRLVHF